MKKKLTDNEIDSVAGGDSYFDCTGAQNAKLNQSICPYCGQTIGDANDGKGINLRCTPCHRKYINQGNGRWMCYEGQNPPC